jgi:oligoendopeptidase F
VVGDAWERLFDETIAGLSFRRRGRELGIESTLNLLTEPDRDKREAARALAEVFGENIRTFARVHNTLAKEKEISTAGARCPRRRPRATSPTTWSPRWSRRCATRSWPPIPKLSHRYYELKAQMAGARPMQVWDRNAPLPMERSRTVGWDEAREMVMEAYAGFDPRMAELAEPFFDKGWIDAGVKPGKAPGAFAHPTVTDVHPYVMLNYLGKPRDVMTLAHELGHGVHQVLAADQGRACCPPRR